MSLSTKHYNSIAAILFIAREKAGTNCEFAINEVIEELSKYFQIDNPKFTPERFKTAAKLGKF